METMTILYVAVLLVIIVGLFVMMFFAPRYKPEPKCKHDWELIKEVYSPPSNRVANASGGAEALQFIAKITCGYTTLVFQCKHCKALHREECLGEAK